MSETLLRLTPHDYLRMLQSDLPSDMLPKIIVLLSEQFDDPVPIQWVESNILSIQKVIKQLPISATMMVTDSFFAISTGAVNVLYKKGISDDLIQKLTEKSWHKIRQYYYEAAIE
jgi:hypothetical protein